MPRTYTSKIFIIPRPDLLRGGRIFYVEGAYLGKGTFYPGTIRIIQNFLLPLLFGKDVVANQGIHSAYGTANWETI